MLLHHWGNLFYCVSHRLKSSNFKCTTYIFGLPREIRAAALAATKSETGLLRGRWLRVLGIGMSNI